jgi:hypothetical protein
VFVPRSLRRKGFDNDRLAYESQLDTISAFLVDLLDAGAEVYGRHDSAGGEGKVDEMRGDERCGQNNGPVTKLLVDDALERVAVDDDDYRSRGQRGMAAPKEEEEDGKHGLS